MGRWTISRGRLWISCLLAALAGCNTGGHTGPVDPETRAKLLTLVLIDGSTTRGDIVQEWGPPLGVYEDDRIWTYTMLRTRSGMLFPARRNQESGEVEYTLWKDASYNLILVFEGQVLKTHRLLRIS